MYADPAALASIGNIDISKYVACGLVVMDPRNGTVLASYRTHAPLDIRALQGRELTNAGGRAAAAAAAQPST